MDIRLSGKFELLSPLSHISEAISTNTYLVQEPILQKDGSLEEIFCYSGNAWRGQLRDATAKYMLDKIGVTLPIDSFHLLFSGGKIGGDQVVDIEAVKIIREKIPLISLFGGGIGNQIVAGKMRVQNSYPICREAERLLPNEFMKESGNRTYRDMTQEKSFTRFDDTKNDEYRKYTHQEKEGTEKKKKEVAQQMRMTSELVSPGVELYTSIDIINANEKDLGALVSAISSISNSPHIGGQANKGHGRINLTYKFEILSENEPGTKDFIKIKDGHCLLSDYAKAYKNTYDLHLDTILDESEDKKENEIMSAFWGKK